jgi:hypothetical protein
VARSPRPPPLDMHTKPEAVRRSSTILSPHRHLISPTSPTTPPEEGDSTDERERARQTPRPRVTEITDPRTIDPRTLPAAGEADENVYVVGTELMWSPRPPRKDHGPYSAAAVMRFLLRMASGHVYEEAALSALIESGCVLPCHAVSPEEVCWRRRLWEWEWDWDWECERE